MPILTVRSLYYGLVNAGAAVTAFPPVRFILKRIYERHFREANRSNLFRGIFPTFEQAALSAPPTKGIGYDQPAPAAMYRERMSRAYPSDYPVLFWLSMLDRSDRLVLFDYGGHVGVSYYAYKRYLKFPEALSWIVCDVPTIRKEGEKLARERGAAPLRFTGSFKDADGADIFLASGSLQYIEEPLATSLAQLQSKPHHLLINKVPLYDGKTFVTLNNMHVAYCPYRVTNKNELIASIVGLGYTLVDTWDIPELSCRIPFYPGHSVASYTGLYFTLAQKH